MNYRSILVVVLLALPIILSSCVSPGTAVPAGFLYKGSFINVRVPNSDGWLLLNTARPGMEFFRFGDAPKETFAAQVLMFPWILTQNKDDFVSLIKQALENDRESQRFDIIEFEFEETDQRSYPCASLTFVALDKLAKTSPTRREALLLQAESLYCRHPIQQQTGFAITYSHRGPSLYSNLHAEARDFIEGVQVPGY